MMDDTQQYQIRSSFTSYYQTVSVYKWYWVHFRCCHSTIMTCKNLPLHFEHSNCTYMVTFPLDNVVIYTIIILLMNVIVGHTTRGLMCDCVTIGDGSLPLQFSPLLLLGCCYAPVTGYCWSILYWLIALIPYHTILQWVNVYVRFNGELFRWWFSL